MGKLTVELWSYEWVGRVILSQSRLNLTCDTNEILQKIVMLRGHRRRMVAVIRCLQSGEDLHSARRFIEKVDRSTMPLIYSHEKSKNVRTEIYGEIIKGLLYEKQSRVLVCYNPDLMAQKCETLDRRVNAVRQAVKSERDADAVKWLISKYNLKRVLKYTENKGKSELQIDYNEIKSRKDRYARIPQVAIYFP